MEGLNLNKFPDIKEQFKLINELLTTQFDKGQIWYLIDINWMKKFRTFVGLDKLEGFDLPAYPGKINNIALLEKDGSEIRSGLVENEDFTIVPESAWNLLSSWYGFADGQEPISRKIVEYGGLEKYYKLEIYLVKLNLCDNFDLIDPIVMEYSAEDTLQKIEDDMRSIFEVPNTWKVRLWELSSSHEFCVLSQESSKKIQEIPLFHNGFVIIEGKSLDDELSLHEIFSEESTASDESPLSTLFGHSPQPELGLRVSQTSASPTEAQGLGIVAYKKGGRPGPCGLVNLRNTCYINSVVQCLSHCPPLVNYFINDEHMLDINNGNTQGSYGEVTMLFGELIQELWSGKYDYITPVEFVAKVEEYSEFTPTQQNDSQHFMAFLLNCLHEDLKIISPKPFTPHTEKLHLDEEEDNAWSNFVYQNNSVIANNVYGIVKCTITCPNCQWITCTFDPFFFLSLPIPIREKRKFKIRHIPFCQTEIITDYIISVQSEGSVKDLFLEMKKYILVPIESMILTKIVKNICHYFKSDETISSIQENCTLVLFDIPIEITGGRVLESHIIIPVAFWEALSDTNGEASIPEKTYNLFGNPFLIIIPLNPITYQELYELIMARMTRYIKGCSTVPSTSCEHTEAMEDKHLQFKIFVAKFVDSFDVQEVLNTDDMITFSDYKDYETIGVQWTEGSRNQWFIETAPKCYDNTMLNLETCLNTFIKAEKLGDGNTWMCSDCETYACASIKCDISKLPKVLILHLKRYTYEKEEPRKINIYVNFPITNLQMDKFMYKQGQKPVIYDLVSVCNHHGSMYSGHYTSFVKYNDGQWFCCNDSNVSGLPESEVVTDAAFLLFYLRREEEILKLPTIHPSTSSSPTSLPSLADTECVDVSKINIESPYSSASRAALGVDLTTASTGPEGVVGSHSRNDSKDSAIDSESDDIFNTFLISWKDQ